MIAWVSGRRFWGKREKMEAKKGESWILIRKKKTNLHEQHAFCLSLPLFCTTTTLFCRTKTSNFLVTHYYTCWLNYFTLVCLWCGRTVGRAGGPCTVTCLPNFLGWVVYHIFSPMVLCYWRVTALTVFFIRKWMAVLPGRKKVAIITRWLYYQGGRKAGF